jgi:hypothetical protein
LRKKNQFNVAKKIYRNGTLRRVGEDLQDALVLGSAGACANPSKNSKSRSRRRRTTNNTRSERKERHTPVFTNQTNIESRVLIITLALEELQNMIQVPRLGAWSWWRKARGHVECFKWEGEQRR